MSAPSTESNEPIRRTNGIVNYRSSALEMTAPGLASAGGAHHVHHVPAVIEANRIAERVREEFKRRRAKGNEANKLSSVNSEEAEKAGRYDRRLKMNRHSAAASRVRREAYIKALEQKLLEESVKYKALQRELDAERDAHNLLRLDVVQPEQSLPAEDDSTVISSVPVADPLTISELKMADELPMAEQISDDAVPPVLAPDPSTEVSGGAIASLFVEDDLQFLSEPPLQLTESDQLDLDTMFPNTLLEEKGKFGTD